MPVKKPINTCKACGRQLDEDPSLPADERFPCPDCGSIGRLVKVEVHDTISFKEKLETKGRHADGSKPFIEQIHGDDLHRKSGKWMQKKRVIDRDNDLYHEQIIDPVTDEIVHECTEPLSNHKGHGGAKKYKKDKKQS